MLVRFAGAYTQKTGCSSCGGGLGLMISSQVRFDIQFPSGLLTFNKGVAYDLNQQDYEHAMLLNSVNKYLFELI